MRRNRIAREDRTELKEYLMALIGNAPFGIFAIDLDGIVTVANTRVLDYLNMGDDLNDVVEQSVFTLIHQMPQVEQMLKKCVADGRHSFDLDCVALETRYLSVKGRTILQGMLITLEDITSRIQAEIYLKQQTEALAKSNQELEEFAYISSHDMKSPISSLSGLLNLMAAKDAVKQEHQKLFKLVQRSTDQIQNTVSALNKVIALRKTLSQESQILQFADVLEEVKVGLYEHISESQAEIHADFSNGERVRFSPIHLQSLLHNLLSNSMKFRQEGVPLRIDITSGMQRDQVFLQITDNGLGLDLKRFKKKLYRLFQRFHTHVEGMGVGLHIIKSIIDSYGGRIELQSQVNVGTTFTIYLGTYSEPEHLIG